MNISCPGGGPERALGPRTTRVSGVRRFDRDPAKNGELVVVPLKDLSPEVLIGRFKQLESDALFATLLAESDAAANVNFFQ
jgi:hypothetical protein